MIELCLAALSNLETLGSSLMCLSLSHCDSSFQVLIFHNEIYAIYFGIDLLFVFAFIALLLFFLGLCS